VSPGTGHSSHHHLHGNVRNRCCPCEGARSLQSPQHNTLFVLAKKNARSFPPESGQILFLEDGCVYRYKVCSNPEYRVKSIAISGGGMPDALIHLLRCTS